MAQLEALASGEKDHPRSQLRRELTTMVISDRHWLYRHPVVSFLLAWRYRAVHSPRAIGVD